MLLCLVRNYAALVTIGIAFLGAGGSAMSLIFAFARSALPVDDAAERAFALAPLRTVLSMAWVFGPSVGALVLAAAGFYGLFLFAAVCFAACGAIVWRMHDSPKGDPHSAPAHYAGELASLLEVTAPEKEETVPPHEGEAHTRAEIWRATVALTLIGLAGSATMIVLPLYVVHGMHGTRIDVSIMLGLGAFLEIPMMLAFGARGSRLDKQRWLAACAAVHMVCFVAVAAGRNVEFLIPMQAFNAFVGAVTSCLGMTYMQNLMSRSPGSATALFFNASRVGSILSACWSWRSAIAAPFSSATRSRSVRWCCSLIRPSGASPCGRGRGSNRVCNAGGPRRSRRASRHGSSPPILYRGTYGMSHGPASRARSPTRQAKRGLFRQRNRTWKETNMAGVGSEKVFENNKVIVWNFVLAPSEETPVHTHEHSYMGTQSKTRRCTSSTRTTRTWASSKCPRAQCIRSSARTALWKCCPNSARARVCAPRTRRATKAARRIAKCWSSTKDPAQ